MSLQSATNHPAPDQILVDIAEYVVDTAITSEEAYTNARHCLMDALGCGILALRYPECCKLLGPLVPGIIVPHGARVPGTTFELDPVQAAFNISCMIRWLDFNDTWLAAEWGHPSDNIGSILAVADYLSRVRLAEITLIRLNVRMPMPFRSISQMVARPRRLLSNILPVIAIVVLRACPNSNRNS